jgi:hypothetical protein
MAMRGHTRLRLPEWMRCSVFRHYAFLLAHRWNVFVNSFDVERKKIRGINDAWNAKDKYFL